MPLRASSWTTWAFAHCRSCRRLKKSPRPSSSPSRPPPNQQRKPPSATSLPKSSAPPAPQAEGPRQAERIQKLLAATGLGSRREMESWIEAGRVRVRGQPAKLGDRAAPGDEITVDGKPVTLARAAQPRVLLYHKPVGELVTRSDPQGRPNVFSRLP